MIRKITILCAILTFNCFAETSLSYEWCTSNNIQLNIINNSQDDLHIRTIMLLDEAKVDKEYFGTIIKKNTSTTIKITRNFVNNNFMLVNASIWLLTTNYKDPTAKNISLAAIVTYNYIPSCSQGFQKVNAYID